MGNLLTAHCHVVDEAARLCEYEPGWSDERVATEAGEGLNRDHAKRFRLDILGELVATSRTSAVTYSDPRCDLLIERFNELTKRLDWPDLRITLDEIKATRP